MDGVTFRSTPYVHQINVSNGGVPKLPVPQARIMPLGLERDHHRNTLLHGGPDRAVCLFSLELIEALQAEGHSIQPGSSGENLTVAGVDWAILKPGDRLAIGREVRLEIMNFTTPCKQNTCWFKDGDYQRISQERHQGWSRLYAKVLNEGLVKVGDPVILEER
ncbi:MAG: MOSC domain-containing protein [Nitrospirae bacterium]|nr:MOSC domain-containing protein [Nitrospirota bacterium]